MVNVRFVEGTADDFDAVYDAEWPIVPRVSEFVEITVGTGQKMTWRVTRVCHVADANEKYVGSHVWIEEDSSRDPMPMAFS